MLPFGQKVRDKITGFAGIVVGRSTWMFGCVQYCVAPSVDEKGSYRDSHWFDDGRLEVIGTGVDTADVRSDKNGGPAVRCAGGALKARQL